MEFSRERGRKQGGHISKATFRDTSFAKSSELVGGCQPDRSMLWACPCLESRCRSRSRDRGHV